MRLLEYLRPGLQSSPEVQDIQKGLQAAIDDLWGAADNCMAQLDVDSATWGLELWEKALGLFTEAEAPLESRRSRVKAKLRGQGTTTVESIRNVAASFANGEVEVKEFPAEYRIEIHFVGADGLPPNLNDLKAAIEEIIPAHLAVGYVSTLKTWGDVARMTWGDVANMTWEELRGGTL